MTNTQMKKALNNEFKANGIIRTIGAVTEVGANTALVFKNGYDMKTLKYLNDRFTNGISVTNTDHSLVFVNTPNQVKVII